MVYSDSVRESLSHPKLFMRATQPQTIIAPPIAELHSSSLQWLRYVYKISERQKRGNEKPRRVISSTEVTRWVKSSTLETPSPINLVAKLRFVLQRPGKTILSLKGANLSLPTNSALLSEDQNLGLSIFKKQNPICYPAHLKTKWRREKEQLVVDKVSEFFIIN